MSDKKMNDFPAAADGAFVYAEDANGNQIKISKADLASVVAGLYGFKKLNATTTYFLNKGVPVMILGEKQGGFVFFTTDQLMAGALFRIPAYGTTDAELVWGDSSVFNASSLNVTRTEDAVYVVNERFDRIKVFITVIGY